MSTQFPSYQDYVARGGMPPRPEPRRVVPPAAPGLGLAVTEAQRERAQGFLAEAYADGRLTELELDQRLDQVMTATTRRDLNAAFYGLVEVPSITQAVGLHPAYRGSLVNQQADGRAGRTLASMSHFSVFFMWIFGPLLMWAISSPGSYAKKEAAKAFNFQVISSGLMMAATVAGSMVGEHVDGPVGLLWIAWFVLTIIGGVKAAKGEDWQNPVNRVIPWRPLKDR